MSIRETASYLYESGHIAVHPFNESNYWSESGNGSRYLSHPLRLSLYDRRGIMDLKYEFCNHNAYISDGRLFHVTMPRKTIVDYPTYMVEQPRNQEVEYKVINCQYDTTESHEIRCKNGFQDIVHCNGTQVTHRIRCPRMRIDLFCTVPGYDKNISTCKLSLSPTNIS